MPRNIPIRTVTLCGSMRVIDEMIDYARQLNERGIETYLPELNEPVDYSTLFSDQRASIKSGLIRNHIQKIQASDAVLICNLTLGDRIDYIGANSFLEMGFAFAFGKMIFLLNDVPDQPNTDEIVGMLPITLNGDLAGIRG